MRFSKFAEELVARIEPPDQCIFFLEVVARGVCLPLGSSGSSIRRKKVLLVPGMVLVVVKNEYPLYTARWVGPTFQTDSNAPKDSPRYSERVTFDVIVTEPIINEGKLVQVPPIFVKKMPNHVPAVLFDD